MPKSDARDTYVNEPPQNQEREASASKLQANHALTAPIGTADRTKDLVLSWAQQRLWFLEQLEDLGGGVSHPGRAAPAG